MGRVGGGSRMSAHIGHALADFRKCPRRHIRDPAVDLSICRYPGGLVRMEVDAGTP